MFLGPMAFFRSRNSVYALFVCFQRRDFFSKKNGRGDDGGPSRTVGIEDEEPRSDGDEGFLKGSDPIKNVMLRYKDEMISS